MSTDRQGKPHWKSPMESHFHATLEADTYVLFVSVERGICETLPFVLREERAVLQGDVVDFVAGAPAVRLLPLLRGLLAFSAAHAHTHAHTRTRTHTQHKEKTSGCGSNPAAAAGKRASQPAVSVWRPGCRCPYKGGHHRHVHTRTLGKLPRKWELPTMPWVRASLPTAHWLWSLFTSIWARTAQRDTGFTESTGFVSFMGTAWQL